MPTQTIATESRKGRYGQERWYLTPDGDFPSVTTIIGQMSGLKSFAITNWAVGKAVDQAIDEAWYEMQRTDNMGSRDDFNKNIKAKLKSSKRADKQEFEAAGEIGTQIHSEISAFLLSGGKPLASPVFDKWLAWWEPLGLKPILVEEPIWSKQYGYAGTLDCVAQDMSTGRTFLIDWKTSSGIYADHHLQTAAYLKALGVYADEAVLIHIPKNKDPIGRHPLGEIGKQTISRDDLFDAFKGLLAAWDILTQA